MRSRIEPAPIHEQVNGWTKYIARGRSAHALTHGYQELEGILESFARAQVLPFSPAAADVYDELRNQSIRFGRSCLHVMLPAGSTGCGGTGR